MRKFKYLQRIRVKGDFGFPIDMLRYDGYCPDKEEDSGKITRSFDPRVEQEEITLWKYVENKTGIGGPTAERWSSFGWKITDIQYVDLL